MSSAWDPKTLWHTDLTAETPTDTFKLYYMDMPEDPEGNGTLTQLLADMGAPIPRYDDELFTAKTDILEFWTALMEWPVVQAIAILSISNSYFFSFIGMYFAYRYLNLSGFEGFAYNDNDKNREDLEEMSW